VNGSLHLGFRRFNRFQVVQVPLPLYPVNGRIQLQSHMVLPINEEDSQAGAKQPVPNKKKKAGLGYPNPAGKTPMDQ
jgi:hypothetical protein